ncbi:DUF3757 domain-containing protein [Pseudomonas frederiksbergensis]|uniref:DUF3757 domain-containing protein n=1 Tax=Pseudomonas frederiksbergensis TaxID=104087 RepID=UPI000F48D0E3|nr:DUF3757 domain-containing protein [Pseudomonas frederiksbergensis]RON54384.1 hypothetical protein BK667_12885 [Pseudomonas frederiksbergensis]
MLRLMRLGLGCLPLVLYSAFVEAQNQYFNVSMWPDSEEACPLPQEIKKHAEIFTSPAKTDDAEWVGVLVGGQNEGVTDFEKGLFVLTQDDYNGVGVLSSCIYRTSGGKYLNMRLELGKQYQRTMWIERVSQWKPSSDHPSPIMLECDSKDLAGCAFHLE